MNLQLPTFLLFETHFANFSSEMLSGVYAGVILLSNTNSHGQMRLSVDIFPVKPGAKTFQIAKFFIPSS